MVAPLERISARAWAALFLVFVVIYVGSLWSPGVLDDADATHAEAAREMARSGDFVTLKVDGVRYLEKAPLTYWMAATSFKIFGENEFALRLPIALGVFLSMLLAAKWARRAFGARAGVYAGLFVLTGTGFYLFTRVFIPEVWLSLFIAASLYFFLTALELPEQSWRWYAGYTSMALAVLTKGLVALVFASGAIFFYLLLSGEWRRWREFKLFRGIGLILIIAAPWHILAGLRNTAGANGHGFFWFYFVNEHFLRFLGRRYPKDYNKMPAVVYWLAHLAWLFPWSLFIPLAIRELWQKFRNHENGDFASRTRLLCVIYAVLILVFFSISTNQEYYTFPAYIPLFILLSGTMVHEEETKDRVSKWLSGAQIFYAAAGMAVAISLFSGLWVSRHLPFVPDIGTVLARRGVGDYTLAMSHLFDLTGESFAALRLPAAIAAIAMLCGPIISLILRCRKKHYAATWTVGVAAAMFLVAAHIAFVRFEPTLSSRTIANELKHTNRPSDKLPSDKLMIYGDHSVFSSLHFYMKQPIYMVNGATTNLQFGSTFPDAPKVFLNDADLLREWNAPQRVYLFVVQDRMPKVEAVLGKSLHPIMQVGDKLVFQNHP